MSGSTADSERATDCTKDWSAIPNSFKDPVDSPSSSDSDGSKSAWSDAESEEGELTEGKRKKRGRKSRKSEEASNEESVEQLLPGEPKSVSISENNPATTPSPKQVSKKQRSDKIDKSPDRSQICFPETTDLSAMSVSSDSGKGLVIDVSFQSDPGGHQGADVSRMSDVEMGASPCNTEETQCQQKQADDLAERELRLEPKPPFKMGKDEGPPEQSGSHSLTSRLAQDLRSIMPPQGGHNDH